MFSFSGAVYVCIGASAGALIRWWLGILLNSIFPSLPLGTLAANIVGGFCMGIIMALATQTALSETTRLALVTGFLGGLTTFSAFSGETVSLILNHEYFWSFMIIVSHVAGSILATFGGIYFIKLLVLGSL